MTEFLLHKRKKIAVAEKEKKKKRKKMGRKYFSVQLK